MNMRAGNALNSQSRTSVSRAGHLHGHTDQPFWRGTGGHAGDQVGTHIGGSRLR